MIDDLLDTETGLRARVTRAVTDCAFDTGLTEDDKELILAARDDLVEAILGAVDDEAVDRMARDYADATHLRALDFRNGATMDLKPAQDMVALWVAAARTMLGDAENYSETEVALPAWSMDVKLAGEYETFTLTVQRKGKLTPHQARLRAETERNEALAEAARLRALYEKPQRRVQCPVCEREDILVGGSGRLRRHRAKGLLCDGSAVLMDEEA